VASCSRRLPWTRWFAADSGSALDPVRSFSSYILASTRSSSDGVCDCVPVPGGRCDLCYCLFFCTILHCSTYTLC
jgi:hypothetical protein